MPDDGKVARLHPSYGRTSQTDAGWLQALAICLTTTARPELRDLTSSIPGAPGQYSGRVGQAFCNTLY